MKNHRDLPSFAIEILLILGMKFILHDEWPPLSRAMSLSIGTLLLLKCHYSILERTVNHAGRFGSAEKTEEIVAGLTVLVASLFPYRAQVLAVFQ